jgi:hypothetical protein
MAYNLPHGDDGKGLVGPLSFEASCVAKARVAAKSPLPGRQFCAKEMFRDDCPGRTLKELTELVIPEWELWAIEKIGHLR